MNKFECHIDVISKDSTIISLLSSQCNLSVSEIKKAIDKGALWHSKGKSTQRCRRLKKTLAIGDKLHFYFDENVLEQTPTPAILIEDLNDYSVWFKPYGMLSQGSKWSDHCTITRWAQKNLQPERSVFSVHRLDRAATGLILVAHSKRAARALTHLFELHKLEKNYQIIVHGDHRSRPQPDVIDSAIEQKKARSHFSCLAYNEKRKQSLINVKIESGRKHQIRIHAASIGFPVVGDRLHGIDKIQLSTSEPSHHNVDTNLQLCAISLSFICPLTQQKKSFSLPEELRPQL